MTTIMRSVAVILTATLAVLHTSPARAADEFGIFENIFESSVSFEDTAVAIEAAIAESKLSLHGSHVIRVPDDIQQAKIYVLTSPAFAAVAAAESPRTVSAQVLRIAVFTMGEGKKTFVNMANPVSHAMVYYAESGNYSALVEAAAAAADEIRQLVSAVPGKATRSQHEPVRSEKHYRKFKGDGPARMMTKFRTWRKSQLLIETDTAENFDSVVEGVAARIAAGTVTDATESLGWDKIAQIRMNDDVVYFGLSNPFIEDKMIRINSRYRNDGKSDNAPYPGVDHVAALPTDVLVVREGGQTLLLQYGQMWRMQLYFWDSGYRAFTANVGVPGDIVESLEAALQLATK